MAEEYLLGVDVGTTSVKAVLVSENGRIAGAASERVAMYTPGSGRCEQDAGDWWNGMVRSVRKVLEGVENAQEVRAIGLSTQGGTIVPTDQDFRPLSRAVVWSDSHCAPDRELFFEALGGEYIYRTTGWPLSQGMPIMVLRRMRLEIPEIFDRAAYFLSVHDYMTARLTGLPMTDLSNGGINRLIDVRNQCYDRRILEFIGVREEQLGKLVKSCQPVGKLTKSAARALGLSESALVVSGTHDQYAAALGAGLCKAGDAMIGTGTAWAVTALAREPDFHTGFSWSVSATEGMWGSMLSILTGGVCLDWLRKNVLGDEKQPLDYDRINEMVRGKNTPGTAGLRFYPYFSGALQPQPDASSRAAFLGLDLSHDRGNMAHAVMEGVACQAAWALRSLQSRGKVNRLFLTGGASRSEIWTRMIAEVAGQPLHVFGSEDLSCIGAAMMAGVGCGLFRDTAQAAEMLAPASRVITPDENRVFAYREVLEQYCREAAELMELYRKR